MYEKLIQVVDCLSPEDLSNIKPTYESLNFTRSKVFLDRDGSQDIQDVRTSEGSFLPEGTPACSIVHRAMNNALLKYKETIKNLCKDYQYWPVIGGFDTKSHREGIQVLRYQPGQTYGFHHDQADYPDQKEYFRQWSVVLYLNDDFEGGGTDFIHTYYKPKAGQALIFPSDWMFSHAGTEVVSGTKYVAVTWYYCNKFDYNNALPPIAK